MKNLKQHIFEKLKVSKASATRKVKDFVPTKYSSVLWRDFIDALETYGEFYLSEIFGNDLPLWNTHNTTNKIVSLRYYDEEDYILAKLLSDSNIEYDHYIEDMSALKYRLGETNSLIGNTIVAEIYDLIK